MIQYLEATSIVIRNKDGEIRRITPNRQRQRYPARNVLVGTLQESEEMRIDLLSNRLYKSPFSVGYIIDTNVEDVFSINKGENVNYVNPEITL